MAISLAAALKLISWSDVVAHAPMVWEKTRDLYRRLIKNKNKPTSLEQAGANQSSSVTELSARLAKAEARLGELDDETVSLAEAINSVAKHNDRLVKTVDVLRRRVELISRVLVVLGIGSVVALFWFNFGRA